MEAERRRHWPTVVEAACSHGIPVALLDALIIQESRYNQAAISPAGAAGLTQLMPQTAVSVGVRNRFSAQESIWGGSRYLKSLLDRFGRMETALAAYNIGPTAVIQNGRPEKNAFVSKVLQHVEHSGVLPLKAVILKLPMPILDDGFVAPAMHTSLIQTQE
jgi:soluble lytic murein transglycosylase-like protein